MSSIRQNKRDICTSNVPISQHSTHHRGLFKPQESSSTFKKDPHIAIKVAITALVLLGFAAIATGSAQAQRVSSSIAWGNYETNGNSSSHADDAYTALLAKKGRSANLPGTTVYSIGVMNTITVVGDDNLLNSTQEGQNNGDVSSQTIFNQ